MNIKYTKLVIFMVGMAAFASCSTSYKMGQTPDDVYYSPAKPKSEYASANDRRGGDSYYNTGNANNRYNANNQYDDPYYSGYDMYRNDRFLRMSIGNRSRWMGYNDYLAYDGFYNYNRFNMYNDFSFGSPMNSYFYWNSFYNPYTPYGYGYSYYPYYGSGIAIGGGSKYPTTSILPSARPRPFNAAGYGNNTYTNNNRYLNTNSYTNPSSNTNNGRYNNANNRTNNSYYNNSNNSRTNSFRTTTPNNNSFFNNNNNSMPSRSYSPASSGSSMGGGSSSGGGGGVSRPTRGGN